LSAFEPTQTDGLSGDQAQALASQTTVEKQVAKLAEKAKNAKSLKELWGKPSVYQKHVDKRIEKKHIKDEADYFAKVKQRLTTATHYSLMEGQYPSVELASKDWSVILGSDGLLNTAYRYEKKGESFTQRQTRLGHTVYEHNISEGLRRQLKQLFD
jgi:hypothetical protein